MSTRAITRLAPRAALVAVIGGLLGCAAGRQVEVPGDFHFGKRIAKLGAVGDTQTDASGLCSTSRTRRACRTRWAPCPI